MNKTLWIADGSKPIWDAATRVARKRGVSVSQLVTDLLEEHLPTLAEEPTTEDRWANIAAESTAA